jgi:hypothetical protein
VSAVATSRFKVLAVIAAVAALAIFIPFTSSFVILLATRALVFSILVMSLDLLLGFTGLASLGQAAYFGVGAYLAAILGAKYQIGLGFDFWLVILLGLLIGAALAGVFGLLAIRASGVYFLMITLALGQCVWGLAYRWNSLTNGDNGINLQARPKFGIDLADQVTFFYVVLAIFAASLFCLYVLVHSPFGRSLAGIRERELRMKILGYNTWHRQPRERGADHLGRCAADGGAGRRRHAGRRGDRRLHRHRVAGISQHGGAVVAVRAGRRLCADDLLPADRIDGNSGAHAAGAQGVRQAEG